MPAFVSAADVRGYLFTQESTAAPSNARFSDGAIGSNIRAASAFLQRRTNRQFEPVTETRLFTTEGRAYIAIPDLRSVSAVTLQDSALTADETYHLIPSPQDRTIFTGIQFRAFGSYDYRSNPGWFDRNLDRDMARYGSIGSLPNDLVIDGAWGWLVYPEELLHATKVLAAWYTKRPDAVLADVATTAEGTQLIYSQLPPEVRDFISSWSLGEQVVAVG